MPWRRADLVCILGVSEAWRIIKGVRAQISEVPRGGCVSLSVFSGASVVPDFLRLKEAPVSASAITAMCTQTFPCIYEDISSHVVVTQRAHPKNLNRTWEIWFILSLYETTSSILG